MTNSYRLTDVEHHYGNRCVVDIPRLEIRTGEILGFVGPSGAGKSTLLRLLNFLETPTRGHLTYDGTRLGTEIPLPLRREVVAVFQHPILLRRSVRANVRISQRIRAAASSGDDVERWLARLGLAEFGDTSARTLSAGEAQRVALARALVVKPSVLLLDEPTGNLDPYNVGLIEEIVRSDNSERGTTVILVTHDILQARRLAQRTGLMIDGQILELTDTEAFFANPQEPQTAAFLRGDLVGTAIPPEPPSTRRERPPRWRHQVGG